MLPGGSAARKRLTCACQLGAGRVAGEAVVHQVGDLALDLQLGHRRLLHPGMLAARVGASLVDVDDLGDDSEERLLRHADDLEAVADRGTPSNTPAGFLCCHLGSAPRVAQPFAARIMSNPSISTTQFVLCSIGSTLQAMGEASRAATV